MNKIPAKQIYLLIVIIVGIVGLSVYSTYSIFTLESSTDDIVNINTPDRITLNTEVYEYRQITIPKNAIITTDIDIYNNIDDSLCYGIWYKVMSGEGNKVKVYEITDTSLTTSGVIESVTSKRVKLLLVNDSDNEVKVNLGLSHEKNSDSCSFNLTSGRSLITATFNDPQLLSNAIIRSTLPRNEEEGYLVYKNNEEEIKLSLNSKISISKAFTYSKEEFSLKEPELIDASELNKYVSNATTSYYTCLETDKCHTLYKINMVKITEEATMITKYDTLVGYLSGESGLRKDDNNYVFYGDNPHNFIYYNCKNELDTSTCELWRIMGFYYNEETNKYLTKIIKDSSLGTYIYDLNNTLYNKSSLSNYLNTEYKMNDNLSVEIEYNEERISEEDESTTIETLPNKSKAKVTLMKLTDYLSASVCENKNPTNYEKSCLYSNWLNKGLNEFTMTSKREKITINLETDEEIITENNIVYTVGSNINETLINNKNHVRPVIYLKERTLLFSGEGTIDNPYMIK